MLCDLGSPLEYAARQGRRKAIRVKGAFLTTHIRQIISQNSKFMEI